MSDIKGESSSTGRATVSVAGSVGRGLNDVRLAVLGILVGIALTVMFGIEASWLWRVGAAVATFGVGAVLIRNRTTKHWMMTFIHWVTRE